MIKRILVIGGANGIGLAISLEMAMRDTTEIVYVVDKVFPPDVSSHPKIKPYQFDLVSSDYSFFDQFDDIDGMMITAGFGRIAHFRDISEQYIIDSFNVNTISAIRLVKRFFPKLEKQTDFYCGVMVSIAGWMSSPLFAVYGATKAALKIFIESVNVELRKTGSPNCILNVSPGTISGTSFYKGKTDLSQIQDLAKEILFCLESKKDLYIPKYDEVFKDVLQRYANDFRKEGDHSYEYKVSSGRLI